MKRVFCTVLKQLRGDMMQEDLAQELGISRSSISHLENGRHEPSLELLERIADFFDVSIDYLVGRTNIRNFNHPKLETEKIKILSSIKEIEKLHSSSLEIITAIKDFLSIS